MLMPFEFEEICLTPTTQVARAKVPGGWLVTMLVNSPRGSTEATTNFVADENHQWEVK